MPIAHDEGGVSRREAMRLLAASTAIAAGTVSADDSTTIPPYTPVGSGWRLMLLGVDAWRDSTTAHGEALYDQVFATTAEMERRRTSALGSIKNDAETIGNYIRLDLAEAIVQEAEDGASQEEVEDAALEVLEDAIADLEKNLYNYWTIDYLGALRRINWFDEDDTGDIELDSSFHLIEKDDDGLSRVQLGQPQGTYLNLDWDSSLFTGIFGSYLDADADENTEVDEFQLDGLYDTGFGEIRPYADLELANGEVVTVPVWLMASHSDNDEEYGIVSLAPFDLAESDIASDLDEYWSTDLGVHDDWVTDLYGVAADRSTWDNDDFPADTQAVVGLSLYEREFDPEDPERYDLLNSREFIEVHRAIRESYTQESGTIMTLVDNVYEAASEGHITAEEVVSGEALLEAAEDGDDYEAAAGYYRAVGLLEQEPDDPVTIEIGKYEAKGILFRTVSTEETDPLPIGEEIDPDEIAGEVHGGLEVLSIDDDSDDDDSLDTSDVSEGDIVDWNLDVPFVITDAPDDDGLEFHERGLFEPEDDPEDIADALLEAYEDELRTREGLEDDEEDDPVGFPSFGLGDDLNGLLGLGIIAAVIALAVGAITN